MGHRSTASVLRRPTSRDDRRFGGGAGAAALAFPLECRGKTVGALVGLDAAPSRASRGSPPATQAALLSALEPGAIALDNALRVPRAEALSVTDDLTQLYNSRYLSQVLRRETKRASRSGRPLSLLFIDLDGFKAINDTHGHLFGSRALIEAAGVIRPAPARPTSSRGSAATSSRSSCPKPAATGAVGGRRAHPRAGRGAPVSARRRPEHPADRLDRGRDAARCGRLSRRAAPGGRRGDVPGQGPRQERHLHAVAERAGAARSGVR